MTLIHRQFMEMALEQAKIGQSRGEVPIGAIVVEQRRRFNNHNNSNSTFHILSRACNLVETTHDASAHAELLALRRASKRKRNWRLIGYNSDNTDTTITLYSTLEPCPMCLSAAQAFRVSSIVYGAPDLRLGAVETYMRLLDDYNHPFHTIETVIPGILQEESADLLRNFFRQRRKEATKDADGGRGKNNGHESKLQILREKLLRWKHST